MEMLNGIYYEGISDKCYQGSSGFITCDFSGTDTGMKGLTESARDMIDKYIAWNIGGIGHNYQTLYLNQWYGYERGTTVASGRETTWNFSNTKRPAIQNENSELDSELFGSVGLMYASDYGYAVGGTKENRNNCLATKLLTSYNECSNNNWLYLKSPEWLLSPVSATVSNVFIILKEGNVDNNYSIWNSNGVRPTVYLSKWVNITGGTGDINSPYELTLGLI